MDKTAIDQCYEKILQQSDNGNQLILAVDVLTILQEFGKPIEKQQIIEAWQEGHHGIYGSVTGESYYNSKYKTL